MPPVPCGWRWTVALLGAATILLAAGSLLGWQAFRHQGQVAARAASERDTVMVWSLTGSRLASMVTDHLLDIAAENYSELFHRDGRWDQLVGDPSIVSHGRWWIDGDEVCVTFARRAGYLPIATDRRLCRSLWINPYSCRAMIQGVDEEFGVRPATELIRMVRGIDDLAGATTPSPPYTYPGCTASRANGIGY